MRTAIVLICLSLLCGCSSTRRLCVEIPEFPEGTRLDMPEHRLRAVEQDVLLQALATITYLHYRTTGKYPTQQELGEIAQPYFHIEYDGGEKPAADITPAGD